MTAYDLSDPMGPLTCVRKCVDNESLIISWVNGFIYLNIFTEYQQVQGKQFVRMTLNPPGQALISWSSHSGRGQTIDKGGSKLATKSNPG